MKNFSFYRFANLELYYPGLRGTLLAGLFDLQVFGRVYISPQEGINGYVTVHENRVHAMVDVIEKSAKEFQGLQLNEQLFKNEKAFTKLHVRWRDSLVSCGNWEPGLDRLLDGHRKTKRLNAEEWNEALESSDSILIDARNAYEVDVGRMEKDIGAGSGSKTFREQIGKTLEELQGKQDKPILMFCTSGIRCEKLSVIMEDHGFENVCLLEGGVTRYVSEAREKGLPVKFKGKLFSFDETLGQTITPDKLAKCHLCSAPTSKHINCSYIPCHKLFVTCESCLEKMHGCCSVDCHENFKNENVVSNFH